MDLAKKQGDEILNAAEETAERIRADANKAAEEIIARARQEATAAEQQTRELMKSAEEKAQVITTNANEEAARIISTARQQAAELEERAQAMVTSAEKKAEEILNEARGKAEEIIRTKTEEASKEAQVILKDARKRAQEEVALMKQEAEQLLARSKKVTQTEIKNKLKKAYQELLADLGAIKETDVIPSLAEDKISEQPEPEATTPTLVETQVVEVKESVQPTKKAEKEAATLYRGTVELVIPPPLGLDKMLQLHKHLRSIPDVEVLNLGVAADKSITIRLVVENPIPLCSILEDLPDVEQVTESPQEIESTMPSRKGGEKAAIKRIIVTTRK